MTQRSTEVKTCARYPAKYNSEHSAFKSEVNIRSTAVNGLLLDNQMSKRNLTINQILLDYAEASGRHC